MIYTKFCNIDQTLVVPINCFNIHFVCSNFDKRKNPSSVRDEYILYVNNFTVILTGNSPLPSFFFFIFGVSKKYVFSLQKEEMSLQSNRMLSSHNNPHLTPQYTQMTHLYDCSQK